jgi:hypothetical protein
LLVTDDGGRVNVEASEKVEMGLFQLVKDIFRVSKLPLSLLRSRQQIQLAVPIKKIKHLTRVCLPSITKSFTTCSYV